jgi:hypothetical protein
MQTVLLLLVQLDNNKKDKRNCNKGTPVHISKRVTLGGVSVHMGPHKIASKFNQNTHPILTNVLYICSALYTLCKLEFSG